MRDVLEDLMTKHEPLYWQTAARAFEESPEKWPGGGFSRKSHWRTLRAAIARMPKPVNDFSPVPWNRDRPMEWFYLAQLNLICEAMHERSLWQHEADAAVRLKDALEGLDLFIQWSCIANTAGTEEFNIRFGREEASDLEQLLTVQPWRSPDHSALFKFLLDRDRERYGDNAPGQVLRYGFPDTTHWIFRAAPHLAAWLNSSLGLSDAAVSGLSWPALVKLAHELRDGALTVHVKRPGNRSGTSKIITAPAVYVEGIPRAGVDEDMDDADEPTADSTPRTPTGEVDWERVPLISRVASNKKEAAE